MLARCPNCGKERDIQASKARKNPLCRSCNAVINGYGATKHRQSEIAAMGYRACADKYGKTFAIKNVQKHLLAHPSKPEQAVEAALIALGVQHYEREYLIETKATGKKKRRYLVDFYLWMDGVELMIEVNGEYIHRLHTKRDARKARLLKKRGYTLLTITDKEAFSPELYTILRAAGIGA